MNGPASLFFDRSAECSAEFMEATTGFEPVNRGFADLGRQHGPERMAPITTHSEEWSAEQTAELPTSPPGWCSHAQGRSAMALRASDVSDASVVSVSYHHQWAATRDARKACGA